MTYITGRTVLITGGASGIGRQMARHFAAAGATVVIWDLDLDQAEAAAGELTRGTARHHHAYRCDVGDKEAVRALAAQVLAEVGPVDVLVNNAGVVSGRHLCELPDEAIETTFRVNVLALYWTTKAFLPQMMERGAGHVVTIASAASLIGVAKQTDYSASKHAALGFDESLRMELRQLAPGVRTTVVCPYYIDTGMFDGVESRFPLFLPILDEADVARRVVEAVRRNRRRLIMPAIVGVLPVARALPTAALDAIAGFLGVNVSMAEFVGRSRPRSISEPSPASR